MKKACDSAYVTDPKPFRTDADVLNLVRALEHMGVVKTYDQGEDNMMMTFVVPSDASHFSLDDMLELEKEFARMKRLRLKAPMRKRKRNPKNLRPAQAKALKSCNN